MTTKRDRRTAKEKIYNYRMTTKTPKTVRKYSKIIQTDKEIKFMNIKRYKIIRK